MASTTTSPCCARPRRPSCTSTLTMRPGIGDTIERGPVPAAAAPRLARQTLPADRRSTPARHGRPRGRSARRSIADRPRPRSSCGPAEAGPDIVGAAFRRPNQQRPPLPYSSDVSPPVSGRRASIPSRDRVRRTSIVRRRPRISTSQVIRAGPRRAPEPSTFARDPAGPEGPALRDSLTAWARSCSDAASAIERPDRIARPDQ